MSMLRRYTFKLYPNAAQAAALDSQRRLHCALYNAALEQRQAAWRGSRERLPWRFYRGAGPAKERKARALGWMTQGLEIKDIRRVFPEYHALSGDSLLFTLKRLDQAYLKYFENVKAWRQAGAKEAPPQPPGFRRSAEYPGFSFRPGRGWKFDLMEGQRSGRTEIRGVPGGVKWRGRFPAHPLSLRMGDVMFRVGDWWLSIAAEMPERARAETDHAGTVEFDLLDNFAVVRTASGECLAGPEETIYIAAEGRIIPLESRGCVEAPAATPQTGGDGRSGLDRTSMARPAATPQTGGDGRNSLPGPSEDDGRVDLVDRTVRPLVAVRRGSCKDRARKRALARALARDARRRREGLHLWTTGLARRFADLTIISPALKDATRSGHGDARQWGAATDIKAKLNRHVLDMAPGMAIQMLEYKIAQRGGRTDVIRREDTKVTVGNEIVAATKANRAAKRTARKAAKGAG